MKKVKFHITVKAIVVFQNKILILKRARPSTDGLGEYELAGGGLEYGETPEEALCREVLEETGLCLIDWQLAYTFTKIREGYQTVGIGYVCTTNSDKVHLSDEHVDYVFVTLSEAKQLLDLEIYQDVENSILNNYKDGECL